MKKEMLEYYAHLTTAAVGALLVGYAVLKYALPLLLPFIIAYLVARSVTPLARSIGNRTRVPTRTVNAILCVLIAAALVGVVISVITYALGEAWSLLGSIARGGGFERVINKLLSLIPEGEGSEALGKYISEALDGVLSRLISAVGALVTSVAGGLPRALLFLLVTVAATLYFALDIDGVTRFFVKIMPKSLHGWLFNNKRRLFSTVSLYLRAYLFIMLVTFIEMLFGFLVLGIDYAVLLAFLVALLDALPLIGVGTILLPIALYNFLAGSTAVGIGLVVIFGVHTVIRQVIEPRIVGKNLGIHPIISLALLYIGYALLGGFGLLLVPILSVTVSALINKDDFSEVA